MRITMLNKYWSPHIGGIEFHARDLAEQLVSDGDSVSAIVAAEDKRSSTDTVGGVEVTRIGRQFSLSSAPVALGTARAIAGAVESSDVMHLHFPSPWSEIAWLYANPGVPTVLTYHSDIVRQRAALAAYRPIMERVLERVDLIIAGSPNMVEHSDELPSRSEKCRVVPYGLHVERFRATPEIEARAVQLRSPLGDRPLVLFVGRLVYYKGADVLVRAMHHFDANVVMIGRGPLEPTLREAAVASGVADRLHIVPPVDEAELAAWYAAADVFCLPSVERTEAFGLVQIEAHAAGVPVVSTDLPTGVPFANLDGVTGLTVPPSDADALGAAIATLIRDRDLRLKLGTQAAARAHRDFTVARMAADTRAVYEEAAEIRKAVSS